MRFKDEVRNSNLAHPLARVGGNTVTNRYGILVPHLLARAGGAVISENSKLSSHPSPRACGRYHGGLLNFEHALPMSSRMWPDVKKVEVPNFGEMFHNLARAGR